MEERYDNCFICGEKNPIGMKLKFNYEDEKATTEVKLPKHFEGYDNIIHGGIVTALLDEAMAKIILYKNMKAVTVNINVDFLRPLSPLKDYMIEGKIVRIDRKVIYAEARIFSENKIFAKAAAKFFVVK